MVLPAPGIPVRHTMSFFTVTDSVYQSINLPEIIIEGACRNFLLRTFVAVESTNEATLDAIERLQAKLEIKASAVRRENMHFTLFFLGEVAEDLADRLKEALSGIIFSPIKITFTHVGAFPNTKSPRVVWIGVDEEAAAGLVGLAKQVEQKLLPLGFRPDKPFKPHLTIFRIRNRMEDLTAKISGFGIQNPVTETVSELRFKKSVLTSNGPIYSDLLVVKAK